VGFERSSRVNGGQAVHNAGNVTVLGTLPCFGNVFRILTLVEIQVKRHDRLDLPPVISS